MAVTRIQVVHSTELKIKEGYSLALEYGLYCYQDGGMEYGYRFIWKKPAGQRLAHKGQARIPSRKMSDKLWKVAESEGWADFGDDISVW